MLKAKSFLMLWGLQLCKHLEKEKLKQQEPPKKTEEEISSDPEDDKQQVLSMLPLQDNNHQKKKQKTEDSSHPPPPPSFRYIKSCLSVEPKTRTENQRDIRGVSFHIGRNGKKSMTLCAPDDSDWTVREAIKKAEDRELFKLAMQRIGLDVPRSGLAKRPRKSQKSSFAFLVL